MKIILQNSDVGKIISDALIAPVDGNICAFGGCAAAVALRNQLQCENHTERMTLFEEIEEQIACIKPLPLGDAELIDIEGYELPWKVLLVTSALPHHVNGRIFSADECASVLTNSLEKACSIALQDGLNSISSTLIGDSYRMSTVLSIRAMLTAFKKFMEKDLNINFCFVDSEKINLAQKACEAFAFNYVIK